MAKMPGTPWTLVVVALTACPCASPAALLSFTSGTGEFFVGTDLWAGNGDGTGDVVAASWTQAVAATSVSISAMIADLHPGPSHPPAMAFLTTSIGPRATIGNQVAPAVSFNAPARYPNPPYTTLFSGLDLAPGTYYLVLVGSADRRTGNVFPVRYSWWGEGVHYGGADNDAIVNLARGFSLGPYFNAYNDPAYCDNAPFCGLIDESFFPASEFDDWDSRQSGYLFFKVETVPEPATAALIALGAFLGIALRTLRCRFFVDK
jgi:hypothetical protein